MGDHTLIIIQRASRPHHILSLPVVIIAIVAFRMVVAVLVFMFTKVVSSRWHLPTILLVPDTISQTPIISIPRLCCGWRRSDLLPTWCRCWHPCSGNNRTQWALWVFIPIKTTSLCINTSSSATVVTFCPPPTISHACLVIEQSDPTISCGCCCRS